MTFKDLQRLVQSQFGPEQSQLLQCLRDKPFWIWDQQQHRQEDIKTKGDCCSNHIIGLPVKDKIEKPFFDYEKMLYDSLLVSNFHNPLKHTFKLKHVWVKKATGLGVTEFFLRFMAWLCLRNNDYRNSQMCIVTGPNQELAIKLIKRMKRLFEEKLGITFDSKETVLELNGCIIEAFPVVQPQNHRSRKPRPLRERSPLEEELIAKGYTVIDSQWITPGYKELTRLGSLFNE